MFQRSIQRADHVRRYSITSAGAGGWEVTLEEDRKLQRRDYYHDWHRVERARALFEREVTELTEQGWCPSADDPARSV